MTEKKSSWVRRFFYSRWFWLSGLVLLLLFLIGNARAYYQEFKVKQEIRSFEERLGSLKREKLESLDILRYVLSDGFVEEKARTELHMKKPGEHVVIVKGRDEENRGDETSTSTRQDMSNPLKWWYYFTHRKLPALTDE